MFCVLVDYLCICLLCPKAEHTVKGVLTGHIWHCLTDCRPLNWTESYSYHGRHCDIWRYITQKNYYQDERPSPHNKDSFNKVITDNANKITMFTSVEILLHACVVNRSVKKNWTFVKTLFPKESLHFFRLKHKLWHQLVIVGVNLATNI